MQRPALRRVFPWRTGLLLCSIPALAIAAFLAWFRWELPPLEGYYLMAYWESSKSAGRADSTAQIEWFYKTAPGRQSEPAIRQDVDSSGSGFLPLGLSHCARERGWTRLVKMPVQSWKSFELATFLQEDFYGNRTFREVIAEPLFFICVIPFIFLYGVVVMKQDLTAEWKRLYEELRDEEFAFDSSALWPRLKGRIVASRYLRLAGTEARLSSSGSSPAMPLHQSANAPTVSEDTGSALRGDHADQLAKLPAAPQRSLIFPGAAAIRSRNAQPKEWDESQWID